MTNEPFYSKDLNCNLKTIDKAPNYYISDKGFVVTKKTMRVRHPYKNKTSKKYDYCDYKINLSVNGKGKIFSIHRLVAEAFIPNPHNLPCVDHVDCDTSNNNVENLRWCTYKQNMNNPLTQKHRNSPYPVYCVEYDKVINSVDELKELLEDKVTDNYITYCFSNAMKGKGTFVNNKKNKIKSFAGLHFIYE